MCPQWSVSNVSLVTGWHTRMWLQADLSGSERLRGGCLLATEDAALADWRHTLLQQLLSVSVAVRGVTPGVTHHHPVTLSPCLSQSQ